MGRKLRFSHRKNSERKQQAAGSCQRGRPSKKCLVSDTFQNLPSLPKDWISNVNEGVVQITKVLLQCHPVLTHSIVVDEITGQWKLYVHGKEVNLTECQTLKALANPVTHVGMVMSVINAVDAMRVCPGHPESDFVEMLKQKKGVIKSANGVVVARLDDYACVYVDRIAYDVTVRSKNCVLLTSNDAIRCSSCSSYRSNLRAIYSNYKSRPKSTSARCQSSSKANYRYLRTPEKHKRLANLRAESTKAKHDVALLRKRIQDTIRKKEVEVDKGLDADLSKILEEHQEAIEKNSEPDSFQQLFWEEQIKARSKQDSRSQRWHPMMVRWCLNMKLLSPSAYSSLRSSGLLKLPSERTLRDYTHWVKAEPGFQPEVDMQLKEEAFSAHLADGNSGGMELQSYVCLVFDEMKVEEGLVYDKESANLIGFVQLDDVSSHLNWCDQKQQTPELATHMLVFMVRGLFSTLTFPYAQFPSHTLSGGGTLSSRVGVHCSFGNAWVQSSCCYC